MSVEFIARLVLGFAVLACLGAAYVAWRQGHGGGTRQRMAASIAALLFCAAAAVIAFGLAR